MKNRIVLFAFISLTTFGCASKSPWKIHGGPQECMSMCASWNLEFTAMVGVGNQERTGYGATACVCQVKASPSSAATSGGAATTSLAAPIAVAQAAAAAAATMHHHHVPVHHHVPMHHHHHVPMVR